jgi:hypothetical protein
VAANAMMMMMMKEGRFAVKAFFLCALCASARKILQWPRKVHKPT